MPKYAQGYTGHVPGAKYGEPGRAARPPSSRPSTSRGRREQARSVDAVNRGNDYNTNYDQVENPFQGDEMTYDSRGGEQNGQNGYPQNGGGGYPPQSEFEPRRYEGEVSRGYSGGSKGSQDEATQVPSRQGQRGEEMGQPQNGYAQGQAQNGYPQGQNGYQRNGRNYEEQRNFEGVQAGNADGRNSKSRSENRQTKSPQGYNPNDVKNPFQGHELAYEDNEHAQSSEAIRAVQRAKKAKEGGGQGQGQQGGPMEGQRRVDGVNAGNKGGTGSGQEGNHDDGKIHAIAGYTGHIPGLKYDFGGTHNSTQVK